MKAIEFPEVNVRIAENQPEYETLPVNVTPDAETNGYFNSITMCFELDEEERKRVAETGQIWQTVLVPADDQFHPIRLSVLKPDLTDYCKCTPDETTGWTEFDGVMKCNICGKQVDPQKLNEVLRQSSEEQKEWETINRKPSE